MNKIDCEICMDLIPLVKDGIASEESYKAVEEHVKECETCRQLYGESHEPAQTTINGKPCMEKDSKAVEWIFSCIIMRRDRIRCQFDRSGRSVL